MFISLSVKNEYRQSIFSRKNGIDSNRTSIIFDNVKLVRWQRTRKNDTGWSTHLRGQVKEISKVGDALVGQSPVIMAPSELLSH